MDLACVKEKTEVPVKTTPLSQLSLQKQDCRIKVRICRIWESTAPFLKGDIFSLECLLIDEEAFSMQATIRKQDAAEFKSRITEGNVYLMEKFIVIPSRKKFVAIDRDYMVQLNNRTNVIHTEENLENIPLYSFNFLTFFEVEKKRYNDTVLTDVLGRLITIGEVTERYIGQLLTPIRNMEIEDSCKNVLPIVLWDQFATSLDERRISAAGATNPVIIVLAGMTVRTFREKVHLSTCSASKIYFDLDIPEIAELLHSFHLTDNSIRRITYDKKETISPQEEMMLNRKSIGDLLCLDVNITENEKFTCEATIMEIDTLYGWWYRACRDCKTAVKTYGDSFWCPRCEDTKVSPIPWYKLNMVVGDESNVVNFTVFGKLAQDLIRIPAQYLAASNNSDPFTLPSVMKTLLNQKHIFQVMPDAQKFRTSIPTFKVLKIFTTNNDAKEKEEGKKKLLLKCEEEIPLSLSPNQKELEPELSTDASPTTEISSSFQQQCNEPCESSRPKRKRRRVQTIDEDCEDIK